VLKYRVLEEFPDFFFCDPDYYPIQQADEMLLARERFAEIQANREDFEVILEQIGLSSQSSYSDEEKLLVYREHKKLSAIPFEMADGGYRFQIQVAKAEGDPSGALVSGVVDSQGAITVEQRSDAFATCPICLAAGSLIDTPSGPIPVEALRPGEPVWTVDGSGERAARPLLRLSKTIAPVSHQVVHLVVGGGSTDGRELWVSPGHPTADGRAVGELQAGDMLDGGEILLGERVPYLGQATYDLLPAGETGFYWANGIRMGSTLSQE